MVYACMSDRVFVTKKKLPTTGELSAEARDIRQFCRTHDFFIEEDPETGELRLKAVEKECGGVNDPEAV